MCNDSRWSVLKNDNCPNCVIFVALNPSLRSGILLPIKTDELWKIPASCPKSYWAYPKSSNCKKTLFGQKLVWIWQLAKKRLSRCGGMCSQNRRRGHFQGARTGPPSVWGLEEQPPSRLLLGNQEEKILKIQVSKHVRVFPQLWTVTTRAFAIYLSTRRSTRWPHVPTVWLLMSDA